MGLKRTRDMKYAFRQEYPYLIYPSPRAVEAGCHLPSVLGLLCTLRVDILLPGASAGDEG